MAKLQNIVKEIYGKEQFKSSILVTEAAREVMRDKFTFKTNIQLIVITAMYFDLISQCALESSVVYQLQGEIKS